MSTKGALLPLNAVKAATLHKTPAWLPVIVNSLSRSARNSLVPWGLSSCGLRCHESGQPRGRSCATYSAFFSACLGAGRVNSKLAYILESIQLSNDMPFSCWCQPGWGGRKRHEGAVRSLQCPAWPAWAPLEGTAGRLWGSISGG